MDLSILIVTYNSAHLIGALLEKVHTELQEFDGEVIVLDNASRDGTAELVREHFPWALLIASEENLGFAAGNNLAAAHARGRALLLLNPDAGPAPGSLARGVALMDEHPDVGPGRRRAARRGWQPPALGADVSDLARRIFYARRLVCPIPDKPDILAVRPPLGRS